jgi:hypothetical protein
MTTDTSVHVAEKFSRTGGFMHFYFSFFLFIKIVQLIAIKTVSLVKEDTVLWKSY